MALTKTPVTGRLPLPDDSIWAGSSVEFRLRGFDVDRASKDVIVTPPVVALLDAQGAFSVDLWPNARGERATAYQVTAQLVDPTTRRTVTVPLGAIVVPEVGPVDLADLLDLTIGPDLPQTIADALDEVSRALAAEVETRAGILQPGADTAFLVRDAAGFVMFRVDANGIRYMGGPVVPTGELVDRAPDVERARAGILRPSARALPVWRRARAGVLQGVGRARIACIGDSNTMGWVALGSGQHRRALSYPSALARRIGGTALEYFGRGLTTDAGYAAYDPRLSVGGGWGTTGPASLGGEMWVNGTTAAALVFTSTVAWDVADVWVALDAAAEVSINGQSFSPAVGQIVRLTHAAALAAVRALEIARISGTVRVIGWSCRNSALPAPEVLNLGRSGWRSDQYADAAAFYSPRAAIPALEADLHLIQLGLNDWNQNRAPTQFRADVQAIIDAVPGDAALIVPMTPSGSKTYGWSEYVAVIETLASANDLPLVDLGVRLGPHAEAMATGWLTDGLHPNAHGYGETAVAISHLLDQ